MKIITNHRSKNLLTKREKEVTSLIVEEYSTIEIANLLYVSSETIKTHRNSIMNKLDVRNVAGIVREAIIKGYIPIKESYNYNSRI